ncbi:hypothetical protein VCHC59B1_3617B, partial [Vibrio cholerae HC-59B1]
RRLTMRSIATI